MNLWVSTLVLALGLIQSSWAQTAEECKVMTTPKSTFEPMYGKWTFIMGYSDNAVFDAMFRSTKSQWVLFNKSPSGNSKQMVEDVGIRHPSYCKYASTVVNIMGNSGVSQKSNFTCNFHSLDTCQDCLLYHVTSINNNNLYQFSNPTSQQQLTGYEAFYLMSKRSTLTDAELAHAKQQAKCLGFKGEPTFLYDPKNTFCEKDDEDDDDD